MNSMAHVTGQVLSGSAPVARATVTLWAATAGAQVQLGTSDLRSTLKGKFLGKSMFRRSVNRLGKEGPVALRHARSWKEIEPLLPTFAVAHVARFLEKSRVRNPLRAEQRRVL